MSEARSLGVLLVGFGATMGAWAVTSGDGDVAVLTALSVVAVGLLLVGVTVRDE